jgi:CheY-like chemotaxis protein
MSSSSGASPVAGLRVFVAEDEFHVLRLIEDMLADLGCVVVNSVSNLPLALQAAETTEAQAAVLDINLAGQSIYPVAQVLKQRGIPILFSTGYDLAGIEPEWKSCSIIQKPFAVEQLHSALLTLQ